MCEKHPRKSGILNKDPDRVPASLSKMVLFLRCFPRILLVKINYIVSPYKEHRPQMTYFNPWYSHGIKLYQYLYLHHSSLHHIYILKTVVVIFRITTMRKSWATETSGMLRCQNIIFWKT